MRWVVTYFVNPYEPEERLVLKEFDDEEEVYRFIATLTSDQCPLFFRSNGDKPNAIRLKLAMAA